ncbi:MAG: hypothetical protein WKF77_27895, partial [Planctomycetaceae bacterium]
MRSTCAEQEEISGSRKTEQIGGQWWRDRVSRGVESFAGPGQGLQKFLVVSLTEGDAAGLQSWLTFTITSPCEIANMARVSANLELQIMELERLRSSCISARDTVHAVRRRLTDLNDQEAERTASIHSHHESGVRVQLERMANDVRD